MARHFPTLGALILLVGATFITRSASGYVLEGPNWPNGSTVVIQLSLGNAGRTLSDGNTSWNAAAAPALDAWNSVLYGVQFSRVMDSTAAVAAGDGVNSLAFADTIFGGSFGSNTLAVTQYYYRGSTMMEADTLVNTAQPWDSYRGPLRSSFDIQRVVLHELGHNLGLGHTSVAGAIMYPYVSDSYTLTADDIAGVQALYAGASGTPTPTPTPSATATPSPTPSVTPTPTPNPTPVPSPSPTVTPEPPQTPDVSVTVIPNSIRSGGTATFLITASPVDPNNSIVVNYAMSGTAMPQKKTKTRYGSPTSSLTIPPGANSATAYFTMSIKGRATQTETMTLMPGSGYNVSTSGSATVLVTK